MPRRRNINIVAGEHEGRTGTILGFEDDGFVYVKIDGGRKQRSDGTACRGFLLTAFLREEEFVRTGDTPRRACG